MRKKNFYAGTYYSPKMYSGASIDTNLISLTLPELRNMNRFPTSKAD